MVMQLGTALAYVEQRRQAFAEEATMYGEGHSDSLVHPGIDEALACRDMLQPAPAQPSTVARPIARLVTVLRAIAHREPPDDHRTPPVAPHGTR